MTSAHETIRAQILALVKEYYAMKFAPKTFDPGKGMVHYAYSSSHPSRIVTKCLDTGFHRCDDFLRERQTRSGLIKREFDRRCAGVSENQKGGFEMIKYGKGESEDTEDFVEWANDYQHYISIRRDLEMKLQHVA